jgi:putative flavoprotein involved in K+ transport
MEATMAKHDQRNGERDGRSRSIECVDTVVVGGGQAGLSVGYHLKRQGVPFLILDASERIGDAWRRRWDSLRLFTPARYNGLDGMPFPAHPDAFVTKDAMADYLEDYAEHFALPVRNGVRVERLSRRGERFVLETTGGTFEAANVVVAMANNQKPKVPPFARQLDDGVTQLHASAYRNPGQLRPGGVLIVGAGNSGSEIAMELAPSHPVWMSGRSTGSFPFRIASPIGLRLLVPLVLRFLFHRVLTVRTPIGRRARPTILSRGGPLIRVLPTDLASAGVVRVPRTVSVDGGLPRLEDGRTLEVANVVWCTGYHPGFSWIDLPIFEEGSDEPRHHRGIAADQPGLFFVGLEFLHALSSEMVHGVGRDARRIAAAVAKHGTAGVSGPIQQEPEHASARADTVHIPGTPAAHPPPTPDSGGVSR